MNDWSVRTHLHFVGIKGVAMTAMAVWAKQAGYQISGSDVAEKFPTDAVLEESKIEYQKEFNAAHIDTLIDTSSLSPEKVLIIYTGAHEGRNNPEVKRAIERGIPVLPHGKALGEITQGKRVIAVAGCHGKTTTAAMIATILIKAGIDVSYTIGSGLIRGLGLPGHAGTSSWFVVEADEYAVEPGIDQSARFLFLDPEVLVVTTVDYDHPDVYPDMAAIGHAYQQLIHRIKPNGHLIWNQDDTHSRTYLSNQTDKQTILGNSVRIEHYQPQGIGSNFELVTGDAATSFELSVPGLHNINNAAMAILASRLTGLSDEAMKLGLLAFEGAARRFEPVGWWHEAQVFDDYAHHPNEIEASLTAAKAAFPDKRVIVIFQPHTYSRTEAMVAEFAQALSLADLTIVVDIYASAREKRGIITSQVIIDQMQAASAWYCPNATDVEFKLGQIVEPGDCVIFMGAGDIGIWAKRLIAGASI